MEEHLVYVGIVFLGVPVTAYLSVTWRIWCEKWIN